MLAICILLISLTHAATTKTMSENDSQLRGKAGMEILNDTASSSFDEDSIVMKQIRSQVEFYSESETAPTTSGDSESSDTGSAKKKVEFHFDLNGTLMGSDSMTDNQIKDKRLTEDQQMVQNVAKTIFPSFLEFYLKIQAMPDIDSKIFIRTFGKDGMALKRLLVEWIDCIQAGFYEGNCATLLFRTDQHLELGGFKDMNLSDNQEEDMQIVHLIPRDIIEQIRTEGPEDFISKHFYEIDGRYYLQPHPVFGGDDKPMWEILHPKKGEESYQPFVLTKSLYDAALTGSLETGNGFVYLYPITQLTKVADQITTTSGKEVDFFFLQDNFKAYNYKNGSIDSLGNLKIGGSGKPLISDEDTIKIFVDDHIKPVQKTDDGAIDNLKIVQCFDKNGEPQALPKKQFMVLPHKAPKDPFGAAEVPVLHLRRAPQPKLFESGKLYAITAVSKKEAGKPDMHPDFNWLAEAILQSTR